MCTVLCSLTKRADVYCSNWFLFALIVSVRRESFLCPCQVLAQVLSVSLYSSVACLKTVLSVPVCHWQPRLHCLLEWIQRQPALS